jgi:sulfur carrier protein ThiS
MRYLPPQAERHRAVFDVDEGATAHALLDQVGMPHDKAHLVLRNGVFMHASERDTVPLQDDDVIAVWPPVAGG